MDGCSRQDPAYRPATGGAPRRGAPPIWAPFPAVTVTIEPHVALAWIDRVATEGSRRRVRDEVAVEEPLEIRVDGEPVAVAMRTPGEDEELAAGFLAGEALLGGADEIVSIGP